jgi:hypothetical protein
MVQRPHFQLKVTTHENFHVGAVYTADMIKLTTFCVVYEIRFLRSSTTLLKVIT